MGTVFNSALSLATDVVLLVEACAVCGLTFWARAQRSGLFLATLASMVVVACCSLPGDLCANGVSSACVTPISCAVPDVTFCPSPTSAVCGGEADWAYFAYKVLFGLMLDLVLLMRGRELVRLDSGAERPDARRSKVMWGFAWACTVLHVGATGVLCYVGCNVSGLESAYFMSDSDVCSGLLPAQIFFIVLAVIGPILTIFVEAEILHKAARERRYYSGEPAEVDGVAGNDAPEDGGEQTQELLRRLDELHVAGFDPRTLEPVQPRAGRKGPELPEDVGEEELLAQSSSAQKQKKRRNWWQTVLEWLPLTAAVLALFVRTMQAVYTFTLPDYGWLDIVYSVAAFLTLALYPAILSLTPVQTRPAHFLDVANDPRLLITFREWADMQFSPLYVTLVQKLCIFKLRSFDLRSKPSG